VPDPQLIRAGNEEAAWPQQVWISDLDDLNGVPLQQVQTLAEVDASAPTETGSPGTFWYDTATKTLWIGTTPFNKFVRVGTRQVFFTAAQGDPDGNPAVSWKGVAVYHFCPSQNQLGAMRISSADTEIENCHFVGSASTAVFFNTTTQPKVLHNLFKWNGQMGLRGYRTTWAEVAYNDFQFNNRKRFAGIGAAGGMKFDTDSIATVRSATSATPCGTTSSTTTPPCG
jgi:hypothetical protein